MAFKAPQHIGVNIFLFLSSSLEDRIFTIFQKSICHRQYSPPHTFQVCNSKEPFLFLSLPRSFSHSWIWIKYLFCFLHNICQEETDGRYPVSICMYAASAIHLKRTDISFRRHPHVRQYHTVYNPQLHFCPIKAVNFSDPFCRHISIGSNLIESPIPLQHAEHPQS